MKQFLLKTWLTMLCLLVGVGVSWADSYTITFKTGSNDGTSVSTSTKCSDLVTAGSNYLSGNLATATNVYNAGGSGLKLGTSSSSGTLKMNLSETGKVSATSIVVRAKQYNSSKATNIALNGKTAQNLSADFADYTFTLNSDITYLELVSTKGTNGGPYCWIESITVNYEGATPTTPYTVTFNAGNKGTCSPLSRTEASAGAGVTVPSVTPNNGYRFKGWSTTEATYTAAALTAGVFKPTADCTLYAFYDREYTATFYVNGTQSGESQSLIEGETIVFPAAPSVDGVTFMGWATAAIDGTQDDAPTMYKSATMGDADVIYYAVFATEEEGGTAWKLVSSLTNGKEYIFATKNVAGAAYALSSSVTTGTSVTVAESGTDKVISGEPANTIIWTAATGWSLTNKGVDTNNKLTINGSTFAINGTGSSNLSWTTSYGLNGQSSSGTTKYYVQCTNTGTFSKSSTNGSTTNRVYAYEKSAGTTYADYCTTVGAPKPTPTLSFANSTYYATMGEPFETPALTNTEEVTVTYTSSETGVATVNATTGAISLVAPGTTVITASFAGDETYKAAVARYELIVSPAKYTVTFGETQNGTITVKNGETVINSGDEVAEGTTLTIECTPTDAENYRFKNWQYKAGEAAWATRTKDFTYTMPSASVQFRANFEEIPTYTVAFSVNGATIQSNLLKEGAAVTAPENPGSIKGKVFTGWVETPSVSADATPAYVNPSTTAQNDVTYYAVFATKEGADDVTYTKVSTISDGTYLMATVTADQFISKTTLAYAGHKLNTASTPVYAWGEVTPVSITENVISTKPETAKEITITVGTGDDAKYFSMYDGESYITMADKGKFTYASSPSYEWELNSDGIHNKGTYDNASTWYIYVNNGNSGAQAEYFVPVKQKNEGNNNGNYYYYAQLFKKDGGATYSNFTTTPTPLILLDENSESTDEVVEEGVKVNVKRAIRAGYWSPLCLPFDMTEEQIADNFGDDAEVKRFSGLEVDGENYNLKFTQATTIEAGTSYMVRLQNPITEINVSDVDVCMSENIYNATTQEDFDADENVISVTFKGNYYNNTTVPEGSYIINSNKFYFVNSSVVNKGFRGYFTVANSANNSNKAVKLNFSFDDILTGIEGITVEGLDNNIFDLQGRRVQRLQKGVNIVNGKKVLR